MARGVHNAPMATEQRTRPAAPKSWASLPVNRVPRTGSDTSILTLIDMLRTVLEQKVPDILEARRYAARLEESVRAGMFARERE